MWYFNTGTVSINKILKNEGVDKSVLIEENCALY